MGVDIGFDMVPPLGKESQTRWDQFINAVLKRYEGDPVIKHHRLEIRFEVGEHPALSRAGYAFRRFSSKVSGTCGLAEPYIREVYRIACTHFGDQVKFWSEYSGQSGYYGWDEVYAVRKAYLSTTFSGTVEEYHASRHD